MIVAFSGCQLFRLSFTCSAPSPEGSLPVPRLAQCGLRCLRDHGDAAAGRQHHGGCFGRCGRQGPPHASMHVVLTLHRAPQCVQHSRLRRVTASFQSPATPVDGATPARGILVSTWGIMGPTWCILGLSWSQLGSISGPAWGILGPAGGILGPAGSILGPARATWGQVGNNREHPGASLGHPWTRREHLRTILGPSWGQLGRLLEDLI